jgi:hypothetical protein
MRRTGQFFWASFATALVASVLVVVCRSAPAHAQGGDSGAIIGYVFDQTGNPLKGIKLTVQSPTQIGGVKHAYSNAEGAFRFPQLVPGTFSIKAEAPRLRTVVQERLQVGINAPAEVNIIMEVAVNKVEEVQVVERAPVVSTTTANVKEVFDVGMVDSMPHDNRDVIFQQVTNYTAGAIKGGRIRGGGGGQTIYMMDGFNMLKQYPTVKASAAYEIQTAAYGAENATAPGGVVNLVSRSGSNKFEMELAATVDNSWMELFRDSQDAAYGSHFYVFNPTVSGPIIKDKLWYSANVEFLTRKTVRERDVEGILPDPRPELRDWYKGTITLAWQITPRSKLRSVTNFDEYYRRNTEGLGYSDDAQGRTYQEKYFTGLIWENLLTDWMVFRSQAGLIGINGEVKPVRCVDEPGTCDFINPIIQKFPRQLVMNNRNSHTRDDAYSLQFINRLEFFLNNKVLGEHHVQIKDNLITQTDTFRRSMPGDHVIELNGPVPDARVDYYSNDPRLEPARYGWFITSTRSIRNTLSLTDTWRPSRHFTVNPGLAYTNATAGNQVTPTVMKGTALSPSLSLAWDATHDGRTAVRTSVNQYVDADVNSIANHTLGTQVTRRCRWNETNGEFDRDCEYGGGVNNSTVGLPCGPTGVDATGQSCRRKLVLPKTWEYTAGVEREVMQGVAMGLDVIYRKFNNQYEKFETNRIWNKAGSRLEPTGAYRNGRATTVSDLETPEEAQRRYVGLTASMNKREGRMKLQGSYTWSRLEGTVLEGFSNRLGDIGPRDIFLNGFLPDDHRHEVKLNATYRVSPWLSTGLRYSYYSGLPYSRVFRNDITGQYEDYRAPVGVNPGNNLNDPSDDRALRMPDLQSFNAQLAFNFMPLIGKDVEAFIDILNVFGLRTTNAVAENDGQDFGVQRGREGPLRFRLGARYKY